MGDVKLMTACGFFLGITTGAVSLVFAYILAGMFCLPLLIFKKVSLKTRLPMAPFFTVSILIFSFLKKGSLPGIWAYGVSCKGTSPSKCMEKPDIFVHVST